MACVTSTTSGTRGGNVKVAPDLPLHVENIKIRKAVNHLLEKTFNALESGWSVMFGSGEFFHVRGCFVSVLPRNRKIYADLESRLQLQQYWLLLDYFKIESKDSR